MIMRGDTPRGLTRAGTMATVGLGMLLLPWMPTNAQDAPKVEDVKPQAPAGQDPLLPPRIEDDETAARKPLREQQRIRSSEDLLKKGDGSRTQVEVDSPAVFDFKNTAGATQILLKQLELAKAVQARALKLHERGAGSLEELYRAQAKVLDLQRRIDGFATVRARELEGAQRILVLAQDEVEIAQKKLMGFQARVAKAEAQRKLAQSQYARLKQMADVAKTVSAEEVEKAQAEVEISEALVQEAKAEAGEAAIGLRQATDRLKKLPPSIRNAPVSEAPEAKAPASPSDSKQRLDELESKLDRVLKELDAMRKDQATKFVQAPGQNLNAPQNNLFWTLIRLADDTTRSDEDVVNVTYATLFDRKPTANEMAQALKVLTAGGKGQRNPGMATLIPILVPTWSDDQPESLVDTLAGDKQLTRDQIIERAYRAVLNRPPTAAERKKWSDQMPQDASRRDQIRELVTGLAKERKMPMAR